MTCYICWTDGRINGDISAYATIPLHAEGTDSAVVFVDCLNVCFIEDRSKKCS